MCLSFSKSKEGELFVKMSHLEIEFQDLEFYETLGRGAAGSVYRGLWRSKEKIVALKKLNLLEKEVLFY